MPDKTPAQTGCEPLDPPALRAIKVGSKWRSLRSGAEVTIASIEGGTIEVRPAAWAFRFWDMAHFRGYFEPAPYIASMKPKGQDA